MTYCTAKIYIKHYTDPNQLNYVSKQTYQNYTAVNSQAHTWKVISESLVAPAKITNIIIDKSSWIINCFIAIRLVISYILQFLYKFIQFLWVWSNNEHYIVDRTITMIHCRDKWCSHLIWFWAISCTTMTSCVQLYNKTLHITLATHSIHLYSYQLSKVLDIVLQNVQ